MLATLARFAAESNDTINPVVPDTLGEIFWGALSFFSLWALMRYVLLPPLLRAREQRAEKEQSDLRAAAAAEEQAEQVRRDYDATLAEARAEAGRVLEDARARAEHERGQKVAAAETEVAQQRQTAMAELEVARGEAVSALGGDVTDLAVAAASKVVDAPLDPTAHRAEVEAYLEGSR